MTYKFNSFSVETKQEILKLEEEIFVATQIKNDKPSKFIKKNKTRERTIFTKLSFMNFTITNDLFTCIDFIEILKAFANKKLEKQQFYNFDGFTAKMKQKDKVDFLEINIRSDRKPIYLDRFKCISLSAKIQKIINRCEAWQE